MKTYNCTLRLAGNILQTIPKFGVSAHEIRVLRFIHGDDAVADPKEIGEVSVNDNDEYLRLAAIYGRDKVERVFGVLLDGFDAWMDLQLDKTPGLATVAQSHPPRPLEGAEESARVSRKAPSRAPAEAFE